MPAALCFPLDALFDTQQPTAAVKVANILDGPFIAMHCATSCGHTCRA